MRAKFILGTATIDSPYIPSIGEVTLYDKMGDGTIITTHIGDGKTPISHLPALANYDIYERVKLLEEKVLKLENDRRI